MSLFFLGNHHSQNYKMKQNMKFPGTCNQKLATLKTVSVFLIHMKRKPQLLLGTRVSNIQIQLSCNHPSLGSPSIHRQGFISLTQGSSSYLRAIIPGKSKSCYPTNLRLFILQKQYWVDWGTHVHVLYLNLRTLQEKFFTAFMITH